MKRFSVVAAAVAAVLAASPAAVSSAPNPGIAYDEVVKFMPNTDAGSVAPPAAFDPDWQKASQPAAAPGGGLFGRIAGAMGSMGAMMQNGIATRHYIAGAKERVDNPSLQTATITDCDARTVTTLNLKDKTYTVVSLDQPPARGPSARTSPGAAPTGDGSKTSIAATTAALGPKTVFAQPADEFQTNVTMTTTHPDGTSEQVTTNLTSYFSKSPMYVQTCRYSGAEMAGPMAAMSRTMRSLYDPAMQVTSSGPPFPRERLSLFDVAAFSGRGSRGGGAATIVTERSNLRPVSAADPVFSVPADFTKVA